MPPVVSRFEPPCGDGLRAAIEEFDCVARAGDRGETMVRDFLRFHEFEEAARSGTTTTYLVVDPGKAPKRLIGYVALSLTQIRLTDGEIKRSEDLGAAHRPDFGAIRIAMIGVDHRFAGQGYGKLLIDTVITFTAHISRDVSVRFIVADAVNTQLDWYKRQGFVENNSGAELKRLANVLERSGVAATSMRLDLGADPRILLERGEVGAEASG